MLERDDSNDKKTDYESFSNIIEGIQFLDADIPAFEAMMLREQEDLVKRYFSDEFETEEFDEYAVDIMSDLDEQWPHTGDQATVSGRVYLLNSDERELVPASWGEPTEEPGDMVSYYVDDVPMRSEGVYITRPHSRGDDDDFEFSSEQDDPGKLISVTHAFEYDPDGDPDSSLALFAKPGELWKHRYETPTLEGVVSRLSYDWPESFAQLEKIMTPGMYPMAVPRRIEKLVKRIGVTLEANPEFRDLAQQYIEHMLHFDDTAPYILQVQGALSLNVSADIDGRENPAGWREYEVAEPLTLIGHYPVVTFLPDPKSKTVDAGLMVGVYNDEHPDVAERVFVSFDSLRAFRGSRTMQSLASRAVQQSLSPEDDEATRRLAESLISLAGVSGDEAHLSFLGNKSTGVSAEELDRQTEQAALQAFENAQLEVVPGVFTSERRERFELIEEFTSRLVAIGRRLSRTPAETPEDARVLASREINTLVQENPHYAEAVNSGNVGLMASGEVLIGRTDQALSQRVRSEYPDLMFIGVNKEEQVTQIIPHDSIKGELMRVEPVVSTLKDKDGDAIGFAGTPAFVVLTGIALHAPAEHQGIALTRAQVSQHAVVYLNGTTQVEVGEARYYRDIESSLAAVTADEALGVAGVSESLEMVAAEVVQKLTDEGSEKLTTFELLHGLGAHIAKGAEGVESQQRAVATLEALFVNRYLWLSGEGAIAGAPEAGPVLLSGAGAEVLDIRTDVVADDTVFAFKLNDQIVHLPFSKISELQF